MREKEGPQETIEEKIKQYQEELRRGDPELREKLGLPEDPEKTREIINTVFNGETPKDMKHRRFERAWQEIERRIREEWENTRPMSLAEIIDFPSQNSQEEDSKGRD